MEKPMITGAMMVAEIVSKYPACRDVFELDGSKGCGGPLGPQDSVGFFAGARHVGESRFVNALNQKFQRGPEIPARPRFRGCRAQR